MKLSDCCSVNGLPQMFGGGTARREARQYRENGLSRRIGVLVDQLPTNGIEGAGVLDIGGGVGGAHLELLRRGAAAAVLVEVAPAYENGARDLASELGHVDAVEYRLGDFVALSDGIDPSDIVVLDRVVCCYPDMPALVEGSAARARRFYLLVAPRENWLWQIFKQMFRVGMWLMRREFRFFLHSLSEIDRRLEGAGFQKMFETESRLWRSTLFARE